MLGIKPETQQRIAEIAGAAAWIFLIVFLALYGCGSQETCKTKTYITRDGAPVQYVTCN